MKKITLGITLVLSAFALTLGAFLIPSKDAESADSITYSSTLPTTIKFKDNTDSEIRQYYSALNKLTTNQRSGTNLLKNLRDIIHDDITYYPYGSVGSAGVTQIYTITDRDWTNSPISSISSGTYNSTKNEITGYSHSAEKDNNPYITMLYVDYQRNGPTRFLNGTAASFDKEHVWSQSHGFKADSGATGPAGTDLHHLIAGEKAVNQQYHSNYTYGNVNVARKEASAGQQSSIAPNFIISGNKTGTAVHTNSKDEESTVFEPCDADKGRIARALLYMVACYNNYSGNETISEFDPNLELVDYIVASGSSVGSSASNPAKYGILSDILEWNRTYKPTAFEIHRNNLIYNNYQFNRNPFIDFPEWADYIWGNAESGYQSTGYAQPTTDTINDFNNDDDVAVTGVSLNKNAISLIKGESETLTATISPANATNQNVTWSSDDTSVATVTNGVVTAVSEGTAEITVTTEDGGFTDTCSVEVSESSGPVSNVVFNLGENGAASHSDGTATETYSQTVSGKTLSITNGVKLYKDAFDATGNSCLKLSTSGDNGSFTINLSGLSNLTQVIIRAAQYKLNTGASITVNNGTPFTMTKQSSNGQYDDIVTNITNQTSLNVTCSGRVMINEIEFVFGNPKTLESISLDTSNVTTTFDVGDTFSYEGLVVTANYSDGSDAVVTPTSVSSPDMSSAGEKTITVTYTEGNNTDSETYTITVEANPTLTWTSPNIDVYSGATLTGSQVNSWNVTYDDGSGHSSTISYNNLTVKLGGTTISIPHTWTASDNGKTLTASYNNLTTGESASVVVTQTLNPVYMDSSQEFEWSHTINQADVTPPWTNSYGTKTLNGKSWTASNPNGDGAYWGLDSNYDKGQQFGKSNDPCTRLILTSSAFAGTITSITVTTSGASQVAATLSVSVGSTAFKRNGNTSVSINSYSNDYEFVGSASGTITITWVQTSSKALYLKGLAVENYTSGESVQIANSDAHKEAQRVVVKYANAFNTAMNSTSNCTENMSSAWSTCSNAYNMFKSEAAALGSTEEAYAKNLIKYATAQYSDDSGEACVERMLKTYEICVQKHSMSSFMNDLVTLERIQTKTSAVELINGTIIVVIIASIGIAALGGYLFIRRYKQK